MFKSVKSLIFVCVFLLTAILPIPASAASLDRSTPVQSTGNSGQLAGLGPLHGYGGWYNGYHLIPTFYINSVARDVSVTITTYNFPAGDSFDVLMNVIGTPGFMAFRWLQCHLEAGERSLSRSTFRPPYMACGKLRSACRATPAQVISRTTGSITTPLLGITGGRGNPPPYYGYGYYPTFFIASVVRDNSVTVVTNNLPANDLFQVLMGPMGAHGINGYPVTTFNTGSGGTQTLTFSVPPAMYGAPQIAIRLQSISGSGFFAFNWFYNNTAY